MIKHSLMAFALGLALNAQGAWAESHSDTHATDAPSSLVIAWRGLLQWHREISTRAERDAEDQRFRAQSKIYHAWKGVSYFPENAVAPNDEHRSRSMAWAVSYSLTGLEEPILFNQNMNAGDVALRFTVKSSSYGHYTFRAVARADERFLIIKLSHSSEVGPIGVSVSRQLRLSEAEFAQILERAEQVRTVGPRSDGVVVFDGAYWVSEIKSLNAYSVNFYHSPPDGPWQDLAREVLLHVEGDKEVLIVKVTIGMLLSEEEERRINQLFK